jgi:hypothetical protein
MPIFRGLRFKPEEEIGLFGIFEIASNIHLQWIHSFNELVVQILEEFKFCNTM